MSDELNQTEAERKKRGSARARQAQRRQQRAVPAEGARQGRQIRPLGQFTLPKIRIPVNRALIGVVAAVVFIAGVVLFLGSLRSDTPTSNRNGLWVGPEWTYAGRDDEEVRAFAQQLRARRIGLVYAWVSWLQPNGTWSSEAEFPNVQRFVTQFRAAYPDARLFGWMSIPMMDDAGRSRLARSAVVEQVAAFSRRVIDELGFDGVFVNVDPVSGVVDGDEDFLALLRSVRAAVGLNTPISAALPPDWSPSGAAITLPPLIAPDTAWGETYKQSVALLVDQLVVLPYQSGFASSEDYSAWVAYQVNAYARAVAALGTRAEILIGIPTLAADPPGYDPAVENIETAVRGIRAGMTQAGDAARYVVGVAIYANWETDDDEWTAYQRAWLR